MTWEAVDGAQKYEVYRSSSKSGTYKKMYTTVKTSYINTTAVAGKKYYYKVKAIHKKAAANSAYSTSKYRICDLARPVVSANNSSKGKIKLTWKAVKGADRYTIYRASSKNGVYKKIKTVSGKTYTDKSLKAKKTYYYKVTAGKKSNSSATSAYSKVIYKKVK